MLRGIAAHFFHVHNFKPLLTSYSGQEVLKTKHNNCRNIRILKCSPKFHKIHAVLQDATRILNNQCNLYSDINYTGLFIASWVYIGCIVSVSIYVCTICFMIS